MSSQASPESDSADDDLPIVFVEGDEVCAAPLHEPWKILVADDDSEVHRITQVVLRDLIFDQRRIELLFARSGIETLRLLSENPDIAVLLLDVVMETEHAGLDVVERLRGELGNRRVRIILRTGQPGQAPEQRVIIDYDIDNYKDKTELTAQKLVTTVISALRSYRDIVTIELREAELARQAARLQDTLDNLDQGIVLLNSEHRLLVSNRVIPGMLGLSPETLRAGMCISGLEAVLGADFFASGQPAPTREQVLADGRVLSVHQATIGDGGRLVALSDISDKYRQEQRIRELLDEFKLIFENAYVGIAYISKRVILKCNRRIAEMFGWGGASDLLGQSTECLYGSTDAWNEDGLMAYQDLEQIGFSDREFEFVRRDGTSIWCHRTGRPIDRSKPHEGSIWVYSDITARKLQDEQIQLAHTIFEHSAEALMIADADNVIVDVNRAFTTITGYEHDEVIGRKPNILKSGRHPDAFYAAIWVALAETGAWRGELWDRRKNGEIYPKWLSISTVHDEQGAIRNYVASFMDISEHKSAQEQIQFLAHHDVLTGLPNRLLLRDRFCQSIETNRRSGRSMAFMFLDLDHFKRINDSLGHRAGDDLLVTVVARLRECLRECDTISRQGGDEFIVLLNEVESPEDVAMALARITTSVSRPYEIAGVRVDTSASIGIAMVPEDGVDFDALLQKADTAMYYAKDQGRDGYSFFRQEMNDAATRRLRLVGDLHQAVARGEFKLVYQPQLSLVTNTLYGSEALLRWLPSGGGVVGPVEFIGVAEECGLILPIGEWVIAEACRQARLWRDAGLPCNIAVNVSGEQVYRTNIPDLLSRWAADAGISPSLIEIELTESVLIHDSSAVQKVIADIKAMGATVAIDDFGTGYSSLSYLSRFQVDKLKIDRSFIMNADVNLEDGAIVRMIVGMAKLLNIQCVAEGVETASQLEFLRECACDRIQGYFISRPVDVAAYEAFARKASGIVPRSY